MEQRVTYEKVTDELAEAVPEFRSTIQEHIADNGEALQHVLFGDLTRFVEAAWEEGDEELVRRCLAFLESALTNGDEKTNNLVAVSFVENVGPWDKEKSGFIETWPTGLRAEARRQGWR